MRCVPAQHERVEALKYLLFDEGTAYAEFVMRMGLSFCNFDFAGCGNSEGAAISFGANEKHDVLAVLDALSDRWNVQRVVLWGRSMGAASALKYC